MTNMIYFFVFGTLIFQVLALETDNIRLANETEATSRGLFGIKPTACMNRINLPSTVPALPAALPLTRLANGRVYFFSPAAPATALASWNQARDYCSMHGMHLVVLDTVRENQLVYAQATALGLTNAGGTLGAWIGLRDIGLNDWRWVLRDTSPAFTAFNVFPVAGSACVSYIAGIAAAGASWTAVPCAAPPIPFICEMELPCSALVSAVNA